MGKKKLLSQTKNNLNYAKKYTILGITSLAVIDLIVEKSIKIIKRPSVFMLFTVLKGNKINQTNFIEKAIINFLMKKIKYICVSKNIAKFCQNQLIQYYCKYFFPLNLVFLKNYFYFN